jgi:hypothetical protein
MSDYRNPNDSNDPLGRDFRDNPETRGANAVWGWIAGVVFLAVVVAVAFSVAHGPNRAGSNNTLANNMSPPASSRMTPPTPAQPLSGPANQAFTPGPRSTTTPQQ